MSGLAFLLVTLAGGAGVRTHFQVDRGTQRALSSWGEPARARLGTPIVNVIGCFPADTATQLMSVGLMSIVSTGFLGGFTTFSMALMDAVTLWADRFRGRSLALALGTWTASWGAALAGITCAGQSFVAQLRPLYGLMGKGLTTIWSFVTAFRALAMLALIC